MLTVAVLQYCISLKPQTDVGGEKQILVAEALTMTILLGMIRCGLYPQPRVCAEASMTLPPGSCRGSALSALAC